MNSPTKQIEAIKKSHEKSHIKINNFIKEIFKKVSNEIKIFPTKIKKIKINYGKRITIDIGDVTAHFTDDSSFGLDSLMDNFIALNGGKILYAGKVLRKD